MTLYNQSNFKQLWYMLYYCRPTLDLYKKTLPKFWEKMVKNRPIIAIISRIFLFHNIAHSVLLNETFRMVGHSILSNNVKFIKIWFE